MAVTAASLAEAGLARLRAAGCEVIFAGAGEVERILASRPVAGVISRTLPLTEAAIAACPTLRVVAKHGVGVDTIDVRACTLRGVPVFTTPGANSRAVVEMTLALMLAAARRIVPADADIRAGGWSRPQDGVELAGRTLGLVGFGRIGQGVARVALALGMRVLAHDPRTRPEELIEGVAMVPDLDAMIPLSDVLSLHIPLRPGMAGLVDRRRLALLPKGAIVINTARGGLIDEHALAEALACGALHSAGLDTLAAEPPDPANPLLALPNVVLASHIGGSTRQALAATAEAAADHVITALDGGAPDMAACVNPEVFALGR